MAYDDILVFILKILLLFMMGTIAGWIIEVFWRRFAGEKKRWLNPGFLNGPWLPLYGFGTVFLFFICNTGLEIYYLVPIFFFGMTLLEYIAGVIFIEHFKIRLWDYSHNRGNFRGLICPLYSLLWTILGLVFYYLLFPVLRQNIELLVDNLELSFFIGIYAGIFAMDLWSSFNMAARIKKFVRESEEKWHVDYEGFKLELRDRLVEGIKNRTHYLLPFHGERGASLRERLKEHRISLSSNLPGPLNLLKNRKQKDQKES